MSAELEACTSQMLQSPSTLGHSPLPGRRWEDEGLAGSVLCRQIHWLCPDKIVNVVLSRDITP